MRALIVAPSKGRSTGAVDVETGESLTLLFAGDVRPPQGSLVELPGILGPVHESPDGDGLFVAQFRVMGETIADVAAWIGEHCTIHEGSLQGAFGGHLTFGDRGINYLAADDPIPDKSTEFWRLAEPLSIRRSNWLGQTRVHYRTSPPSPMAFKYTGAREPVEFIPVGSIVRLVLGGLWENEKYGPSYWPRLSAWF